jgi:predicted permease
VQIALGLALLSAAASLGGGLRQLSATDPGFRSDSVVGFDFSVPNDHSPDDRRRFYADALREVEGIPGVASAGLITFLPPETRAGVFMAITVGGAPAPAAGAPVLRANHLVTSEDYFATVGLRMAEGRPFTVADDGGAPAVVIVNEAFARRYFPDGRAIGRQVGVAYDGGKLREVVGVVRDSHDRGLGRAAIPTVYVPFRQFALMYGAMAVRTHVPPTSVVPEIRRRLQRLDAGVPLANFQTLDARIRMSLDEPRFYTYLAVVCAGMAVLFVSLGLYGLVSFSVAQRTPEFGIRMAIGASGSSILRLVLTQGAWMAAAGTAIGVALAFAFARVLGALPFHVQPVGARTLGGAAALVAGVTLLASYVPARRASRVSPLEALRAE